MDRNKRPALTSPWKIGLLVSLLLVIVSIGVGFTITRTFGVDWTWLHLGDGSWAFNADAFLREMLPLVLTVPLLSLIAYFVITSAVRRYKAYLDSGLDYKRLVRALDKVDDLQENKLKTLVDYPELRDFLQTIRHRISEREKKIEERAEEIKAMKDVIASSDQFGADSAVLISAIKLGPEVGFQEDLALSVPEMRNVEKAIRERLLTHSNAVPMTDNEIAEHLSIAREELIESVKTLKQMVAEMMTEMVASQNGAREIELHVSQLKMATGADEALTHGDAPRDAEYTQALIDRLDQASEALTSLAEKARGMAINTALHAGSTEAGVTDLVKLADDVRDVATGFNTIAAQYQEIGGQLRTALKSLPTTNAPSNETHDMLEAMSGKIKLWVERAVVLGEKMNAFEKQLVDDSTNLEIRLGGQTTAENYQEVPELSIDNAADRYPSIIDEETVPADEFERPDAATATLDSDATPTPVETPPDENRFEEFDDESEDELFANIPPTDAREEQQPGVQPKPTVEDQTEPLPQAQDVTPVAEGAAPGEMFEEMTPPVPGEVPPSPAESGTEETSVDSSTASEEETSVSSPSSDEASPASASTGETPPPVTATSETPEQQAEEIIIDLYELGAVDYEPNVHQST